MASKRLVNEGRAGVGFVEGLLVVVVFVVIFVSTLAIVESGRRPTRVLEIARAEGRAQRMLFRLEEELAGALGARPASLLTEEATAGDRRRLGVASLVGFPPRGIVQVGGAAAEHVAYARLGPGAGAPPEDPGTAGGLLDLERGVQCTAPAAHPAGTEVIWTGLAEPLRNLSDLGPGGTIPREPDGTSLEAGFPTPFRGTGTGFSYRLPLVTSAGSGQGELVLGARTEDGTVPGGWMALEFRPRSVFDEADAGVDANHDGDRGDLFDVGSLWRVAWDAETGAVLEEVELGPPAILQETCNRGGDLDGDAYDDPIFLWNPESQVLRIRLFLVGRSLEGEPIVRGVSATLLLRNDPELE